MYQTTNTLWILDSEKCLFFLCFRMKLIGIWESAVVFLYCPENIAHCLQSHLSSYRNGLPWTLSFHPTFLSIHGLGFLLTFLVFYNMQRQSILLLCPPTPCWNELKGGKLAGMNIYRFVSYVHMCWSHTVWKTMKGENDWILNIFSKKEMKMWKTKQSLE